MTSELGLRLAERHVAVPPRLGVDVKAAWDAVPDYAKDGYRLSSLQGSLMQERFVEFVKDGSGQ